MSETGKNFFLLSSVGTNLLSLFNIKDKDIQVKMKFLKKMNATELKE